MRPTTFDISATFGRPRFETAAYAIIAFLIVTSPAFETDDVSFFNYINNVVGARPLYYYTGYVHLIPQVITYAVSPLPLLAQVLLYPVVPVCLAVLLFRELARLFARHASLLEAGLLALAVICVLRVVEGVLWANVSNAMWLALLVATLVIIRCDLDQQRYSWCAATGVAIAGIAFPIGGLLAGVLIAVAMQAADARRRAQNVTLALVIVTWHVFTAVSTPDGVWNARLSQVPWRFLAGFRESKFASVIVVISLATLALLLMQEYRRRRGASLTLVVALGGIGWGSIALYVLSSRFERYHGGFQPRYVIPVLFCAMVATGWWAITAEEPRRSRRVGLVLGASAASAAIFFYANLRGPLETSLMKYRFVELADDARRHCRPDAVFVFESDAAWPVVYCQPQVFPAGMTVVREFTPSVGDRSTGRDHDDELPYIINPTPLF